MWNFIPEKESGTIQVPFFEDARADFAPYYSTSIKEVSAKAQVVAEFGKLNASVLAFDRGSFEINKRKRYGYLIRFTMQGAEGVIRVAALPMRSYTAIKENKARVQALLNVRDWLKCAVTMQVFTPDSSPLIPYLLIDGLHTVSEYVLNKGNLPMLESPKPEILIEKTAP